MQDRKMFFVYNPKAGKARVKNHLMNIVDIFVKSGYEVTIYPTQGPGDAIRAVRERRPGYDMVVCSGGDGTLDEVVKGMIESDELLPLGYVPAGSTNDFATSLKLPKNMVKAAMTVMQGKNFACDIGSFNQSFFVYIAAFGLFTDVSYGTGQEMKNMLGHMAYILEGMKRIPSFRSYRMRVSYGETTVEGDFIYGMVTNTVSVGGFKGITGKCVELNDGEFEVTLIRRPMNPLELNDIIGALMNREAKSEMLITFKTSKLDIKAEDPVAWTLDGEYGGEHQRVSIENYKQAVNIRVNKSFGKEKKKM